MANLTRPPPKILFIHDGRSPDREVSYLRKAGLEVTESHADDAVAIAVDLQPDIIVLDYDCDGELVAVLKETYRTRTIPIIALAELSTE